MGLLEDRARNAKDAEIIKKKDQISKKAKQIKKKTKEVSYNINGKVKKKKMPGGIKFLISLVCLVVMFFSLIWTTSAFDDDGSENNNLVREPDITAIKTYQTYLKDHPKDDFDNDGLDNSTEEKYKTNIWQPDSDYDGISDYAEIYITETSPVKASDEISKIMEEKDAYKGNKLSTPYKVDDVVMWPDSYIYKARGGVVKTLNGYRFYNYQGWAQFPTGTNAYKYAKGIHSEIPYNEDAKAFYISDASEIRVYDKPLEFEYMIHLPFIGDKYFSQNIPGEILSHILPQNSGLIYCHKQATIDKDEKRITEIDITGIDDLLVNENRFSKNDTSLSALDWAYKMIQAEKCVSTSLYSDDYGELLVTIYGYTEEGNLLVADKDLNKIGEIQIYNVSSGILGKNNDISYFSRYEWVGLGFSSFKNDRIAFLEYKPEATNNDTEVDKFLNENEVENNNGQSAAGTAVGDAINDDNKSESDNSVISELPESNEVTSEVSSVIPEPESSESEQSIVGSSSSNIPETESSVIDETEEDPDEVITF